LISSFLDTTIEERRRLVRSCKLGIKWVEYPVPLAVFIGDEKYLEHPSLSPIQFSAVEACSELFDIDAAMADPYRVTFRQPQYTGAVLVWGMSSGKDTVAMIIQARLLYLLGCLVDPLGLLTKFESEPARHTGIDFLNVAVSKDQAEGRFFDPLKRLLRRSPWFMDKLQVRIMDRVIHAPPIIGHDPDKGDMYAVNAWSGHSSQEAMMGGNLLCVVLDEIDAFRSLKFSQGGDRKIATSVTAESMHKALRLTSQSRFPGFGKVIMLSWPRYHGSFIEQKLAEGKDDPGIYTSGPHATWDVNPTKVEADFAVERKRDPEGTRAKYEARPGRAIEGYFTNVAAVLRCFSGLQTDAFKIIRNEDEPGREPPLDYETMQLLPGLLGKPEPGAKHCWHVDLALTGDRAAAAMAHHSGWVEDEYGDILPVIKLDLVYWWESREGQEIDFAGIRRLMLDVIRMGHRTVSITFDGFQSSDSMQILRRHTQQGRRARIGRDGKPTRPTIDAKHFSMDMGTRGYDTLKEVIYEPGRIDAFYCRLLIEELLGLISIGGKKVDHQTGSSKDVADAVGGAVWGAVNNLNEQLERTAYRPVGMPGAIIVGAKTASQWDIDDGEISPTGIIETPEKRREKRRKAFG